jgi:hypothetical protein
MRAQVVDKIQYQLCTLLVSHFFFFCFFFAAAFRKEEKYRKEMEAGLSDLIKENGSPSIFVLRLRSQAQLMLVSMAMPIPMSASDTAKSCEW